MLKKSTWVTLFTLAYITSIFYVIYASISRSYRYTDIDIRLRYKYDPPFAQVVCLINTADIIPTMDYDALEQNTA